MRKTLLIFLYFISVINTAEAENKPINDQLIEAAKTNSFGIEYNQGTFSGPGWELLIKEGKSSQFFLMGEEHGIAQVPKLASALFKALMPTGYTQFVIETSPTMAAAMESAAQKGMDHLTKMLKKDASKVAFFTMREEAEMIVEVLKNTASSSNTFWGIDYEVIADRHLISILESKNKNPNAESKLAELKLSSNNSWKQYYETRNPQYVFSFSGAPSLVRDLREAWPKADDEALSIMNTLEKTLKINQLFISGKSWESNFQRANLIKENFKQHLSQVNKDVKIFFKMGASHLVRGRSNTEVYDVGNLIPELASLNDNKSFNLMVLQGKGSKTAVFNPTQMKYFEGPAKDKYSQGLDVLTQNVFKDSYTLIDLRPLRTIMSWKQAQNVELNRVIHGYDALLVLTGSTPSKDLFE